MRSQTQTVARVCRRFPRLLEALTEGHLHLTGASLIAAHLTEENVEQLIAVARGRTRREIEESLVRLAPKETFAPSLRKCPSPHAMVGNLVVMDEASEAVVVEEAIPEARPGGHITPNLLEPATEDRYNFRFSAGMAFTEKFRRLAEVLGVERPENHIEEVLDQAIELALEKKDPKRKLERRKKREARREVRPKVAEPQETLNTEASGLTAATVTRYIPSEVRERVFERADYQCEYRGLDGTRCTCRTGLQVEHTKPFAVHRSHDEKDLRAYCAAHNRFEARRFYGAAFIEGKIDAARRARVRAGSTLDS